MYTLDKSKAIELRLSNDTFFYIYQEDEPVLGINENEMQSVFSKFENGFEVLNWEYADNNTVLCTLAPYIECNLDFDKSFELIRGSMFMVKEIGDNKLHVCLFKEDTGIVYEQDAEIEFNQRGDKYFRTKYGSILFLNNFVDMH